jgi:D-alanyl-D-alanine dipeptidase
MNKNYSDLEKDIVRYQDLLGIQVKDNFEDFVVIDPKVVPNDYQDRSSDMKKITGVLVVVRRTVYEKLIKAQKELKLINKDYSLLVTYGYRSLDIQIKSFLKQLENPIFPFFANPLDLYEAIHRFVAVPTVAGHPTGGAVDLVIINIKTGQAIDFGSLQYDYSNKDCYVFSPYVSKRSKKNRMILRKVMTEAGFAPFDGEWWHYSYGDKEWAFYYKYPLSIYEQVDVKYVKTHIISSFYER